MQWLGLTVKLGNLNGIILDFNSRTDEYLIDLENNTREVVKRSRVFLNADYDPDPELARFRLANSSDRLTFTSSGWDIISADDDLDDRENDLYDSGRVVGDQLTGLMHSDDEGFVEPAGRDNPESWGGAELIQEKPMNPDLFPSDDGPQIPFVRPDLSQQEAYFASISQEAANLGRAYGEDPSLEYCPEAGCHGTMKKASSSNDFVCTHCGHREPVMEVVARRKEAFIQALLPMAIRALPFLHAAMGSGKAIAGGQEQNVGGQGTDAGSLMVTGANDTDDGNPGNDIEGDSKVEPSGSQDHMEAMSDGAEFLKQIETEGAGSQSPAFALFVQHFPKIDEWSKKAEPCDDPDVHSVLKAFEEEFGDALKKAASYKVVSIFGELAGPTQMMNNADGTGACPVCKKPIEEISSSGRCVGPNPQACPIFPNQTAGQQKPGWGMFNASSVEEDDDMDKTAARRPKMCPVHENMVEFALTLGDPTAAIQAMSPALFSPSSCKGGWVGTNKSGNEYKCRFKPEMVTQAYWDQKDAEAEQKRLQREQEQQALEMPQEIPVAEEETTLLPDEQEFVLNTAEDEIPDTAAVELPTDYDPAPPYEAPMQQAAPMPVADNVIQMPTAPVAPAPLAVAAKVAKGDEDYYEESQPDADYDSMGAESVADEDGEPLKRGSTYEMRNPAIETKIPDRVVITKIAPTHVEFYRADDFGFEIKGTVHTEEIKDLGITFSKYVDHPNARGEAVTNSDNTGYTGPGQTDLSSGKSSKTAGRYFSPNEQRALINEDGEARNLDKLSLEGTHYKQEDSADPHFLWGSLG